MQQVDARLALIRHALAPEAAPALVSPLHRRKSLGQKMAAQVEGLYPITGEMREEYAYVFDERVSVYVYEGMPERCRSKLVMPDCCAYHLALLDVGCLEFWAYPKLESCVVRVPTPRPVGVCSRCESVGHVVERCSFGVSDVDTMKSARLRRDRRAGREAAA
jgi:hypothetical protein